MDGLSLPSLPSCDREVLEMQFDEVRATRALHDCCGDKEQGPYCMTMAFLQVN